MLVVFLVFLAQPHAASDIGNYDKGVCDEASFLQVSTDTKVRRSESGSLAAAEVVGASARLDKAQKTLSRPFDPSSSESDFIALSCSSGRASFQSCKQFFQRQWKVRQVLLAEGEKTRTVAGSQGSLTVVFAIIGAACVITLIAVFCFWRDQGSPSEGDGWESAKPTPPSPVASWPQQGSGKDGEKVLAKGGEPPVQPQQTQEVVSSASITGSLGVNSLVAEGFKFVVKVPPLQNMARTNAKNLQVFDNQGNVFVVMSFLDKQERNARNLQFEEYFSVCSGSDSQKELAICGFDRTRGQQLQCQISKPEKVGSSFFGLFNEEPDHSFATKGNKVFTLFLASGRRLLTVKLKGDVRYRNIEIVDGSTSSKLIAKTSGSGLSESDNYTVECYPGSDVILCVIALTAMDRLVAGESRK